MTSPLPMKMMGPSISWHRGHGVLPKKLQIGVHRPFPAEEICNRFVFVPGQIRLTDVVFNLRTGFCIQQPFATLLEAGD